MKRGFSRSTWEKYSVGDDGKGNIAMPYYENGKIVMMKFREPKEGGRKGWREPDGKPVFWGMQHCEPDKPLTICEGEMDLLALVESGVQNVVSMPSGAQDLTCIDLCWEWLKQFKLIILWVDNDGPGKELQRNLIRRLGAWRCAVVETEYKDANEVLLVEGKDAVYSAWFGAVEVSQAGLIRLADVQTFDFSKAVRAMSGFRGLDQVLGGFFMGQTTVWTGKSTAGKSTLLGQVMLNAVDQGYSVCAYSGELPSPIFRYWIDLQAAGPENVATVYDMYREDYVSKVNLDVVRRIHDWYYDKFFMYDSFIAPTETNLFEVFEYAARRYDCKVFMVDNLMTLMLETSSDKDWWSQQRTLINRLCNFARTMEVHVHVVAHPKKVRGNSPEREDVSGVAEITNRVDTVLIHKRLNEQKPDFNNVDAILTVDKNRMFGKQNIDIGLVFDDKCKRYYQPLQGQKTYGWMRKPGEDDY
jgi:twinkle protein